MTTIRELLTSAFRKAGVLSLNQTPSASMINDALSALNNLLDSWSNDSSFIVARAWETFPIVSSQSTYTIGPGGDFNTSRPLNICGSYVRLGTVDYPVVTIDDEIYTTQIMIKNITGIPEWLSYDNGFPIGKIRLFPVPSAAYQLFILSEKPISDFGLDDDVTLAPGWKRAIIFNMADEICGDYGQETPDTVLRTAQKSLSLIRKQIMRQRSMDAYPQGVSVNNIYTGWFK